jgi:hypothetical protein
MARWTKTIDERFWDKIDRNGPIPPHRPDLGPCYVWTAHRQSDGYGTFKVDGNTVLAHRWIWQRTHGVLPRKIETCHHCDNPACVRLDHLFTGTHADNVRDSVSKGRHVAREGLLNGAHTHPERRARSCGDKNGSRVHRERMRRGSLSPASKLNESVVSEILDLKETGVVQRLVAARYGVSTATIGLIWQRKIWKHVLR